jgi:hypothetical protein
VKRGDRRYECCELRAILGVPSGSQEVRRIGTNQDVSHVSKFTVNAINPSPRETLAEVI